MAATHEDLSRTHEVKASSNRSFGWVFTAFFLIVALWPLVSGGRVRWWSLLLAAALALATVAAPNLLALPNRLWQRLGLLLNRIISPVALAILFYLVLTPMGALMRMLGKDTLRLRRSESDASYWIEREPPGPKPDSLNHQF
jgi:saxitoxin biosynthesis operon SxtJ-like protein